jgi:uncharacterized protein YndB with AHSA1/START domain
MAARSDPLSLHLERVLPALRPVVFAACAEPADLAQWWGPRGFTVPGVELDLRVGGRYRITMKPPDADAFDLSGEFRGIDAPRLLSYTFWWEQPDPDDQETLVTLSFAEDDEGTRLTVDHGVFRTGARLALHVRGWAETLDRLDGFLTRRRPDPRTREAPTA